MKFIELHLPIEAGKHNMHTDSEELSDSVSVDGGTPVDFCTRLSLSSLKGHVLATCASVCVWRGGGVGG